MRNSRLTIINKGNKLVVVNRGQYGHMQYFNETL